MPNFEITSPDGRKFQVTAPEGATQEQVLAYAQANMPKAEPQEPSIGDSIKRAGGLLFRDVAEGVSALPTMVGDAANKAINAVAGTHLAMPSELVSQELTRMGVPVPQGMEVLPNAIGSALASGGGIIGAANKVAPAVSGGARAVADVLRAEPGMQAASNAAGVIGGDIARENDAGTGGQLAASLLASLVPGVAKAGGSAALRGSIRGGDQGRQAYSDRLQTFSDAGIEPTVGQASGSRVTQGVEAGLGKVPGGSGVFARQAETEAAQMKAKVEALAANLAPNVTGSKAGMTIDKGIRNFVDRFRAEQDFLYSNVDHFIPPDTPVSVANVGQKLADLIKPINGAPNLSEGMTNPTIVKLATMLQADAPNGAIPYQAVKQLRTTIGQKISNPSLTDDIPTAQWKQLYGALSDDMGAAAQAAGPDAERAFNRANAFTKAGHDRIESVLDRVSGKDSAEKVFQAAVNPSEVKEGATTINAVMRSLNPDERKVVSGAVLKRLGQATAGNQNAEGDAFSTATFLTNWNKISPEAKRVLFSDKDTAVGLEALAKSADMIKSGSKVLSNPSGTAPTAVSLGAGIVGALNPILGAKILTAIAAARGGAKLMTNPDFVKWVGKTTQLSPGMLPGSIQSLVAQSKNWGPEDREAVAEFARTASAGN